MTILTVRYFVRKQNKMVKLKIPADVLEVNLPDNPDEGLPPLVVTVNTDAVLIDGADGGKLDTVYFNEVVGSRETGEKPPASGPRP
jgi:hypothetical protein